MARFARAAATLLLIAGGGYFIYRGSETYFEARHAQQTAALDWQRSASKTPPSPEGMPMPQAPGRNVEGSSGRTRTMPRSIPEGKVFARLQVPRLGKSLFVVEGDASYALAKGPGHVRGSAMPGQRGNCVIAGHRDLHFRFLKDVKAGDEVAIEDASGRFRYRVTGMQIISPTQVSVMKPTAEPELHLITCYPFYFIGHAPKRFVVTAKLEGAVPQETQAEAAPQSGLQEPTPKPVSLRRFTRPAPVRRASAIDGKSADEATRALNRAAASGDL